LPFGGVGNSGTGRVKGKFGFDSCSNMKSVLDTKSGDPYPNNQRFPPYT
jgi:acyl-CoA reductase-like NAD-dependent aldehyde dehydrogenase